jgi:hypothetical protein
MQPLTQYGRMAEKHWREAEEKTKDEMDTLMRELRQQGLNAQQAHDQAWEMVRERYILLSSEE